VIARRLACLCFAAIQSSVISITNTIYDIASSPHCSEYLLAMRDEILDEMDSQSKPGLNNPKSSPWGKAALARMVHVDSALRESMRLNGFVARGIMKTVVAPGGVTLPDGSHVPYGTKVGIQAYSVHRDDAVYAEAETYDAFRFVPASRKTGDTSSSGSDSESSSSSVDFSVRKKASPAAAGKDTKARLARDDVARHQPQALVTTSPTFLAFSHGPHAWYVSLFASSAPLLPPASVLRSYDYIMLTTPSTS
jgi:cytochrome P450